MTTVLLTADDGDVSTCVLSLVLIQFHDLFLSASGTHGAAQSETSQNVGGHVCCAFRWCASGPIVARLPSPLTWSRPFGPDSCLCWYVVVLLAFGSAVCVSTWEGRGERLLLFVACGQLHGREYQVIRRAVFVRAKCSVHPVTVFF